MSKAYMVNSIKQDVTINAMGKEVNLPLSDLADGCIGVSLWFDTKKHALEWAQDGDVISEATYKSRSNL